MFGGMGTYAPGYVRPGTGGAAESASSRSGSVTRGGFGSGQGMEKQRAGGALSSDGEPG